MSESTVLALAAGLKTIIRINIKTANAQKRSTKNNMSIILEQEVGAVAIVGCPANPSALTDRHSEERHAQQSAGR